MTKLRNPAEEPKWSGLLLTSPQFLDQVLQLSAIVVERSDCMSDYFCNENQEYFCTFSLSRVSGQRDCFWHFKCKIG